MKAHGELIEQLHEHKLSPKSETKTLRFLGRPELTDAITKHLFLGENPDFDSLRECWPRTSLRTIQSPGSQHAEVLALSNLISRSVRKKMPLRLGSSAGDIFGTTHDRQKNGQSLNRSIEIASTFIETKERKRIVIRVLSQGSLVLRVPPRQFGKRIWLISDSLLA